ncbi:HU family DNA-binding protein [Vibrio parahaemolyticus]|uniref:HU family DNA-binding protein n=1 Tax=Vibrio alginolyticus TaxID=663 RepID=UPI0006992E74|nr:HU family DNA-binding protein [Vibrio alginolyticus]EJV5946464.1 HU family DNA-binding protein [Vibrio parahaemolyticus]ELJ1804481.1 HU family DNA-binding protein [Vibrio parahaemolyticus]MCR9484119.1 HU family DNA-binding protein [Vibrio alginolyticus]MDM4739720.1 HU family DNA-binding protein [Vibrio alginolyticus]MDM4760069.1 HU family DNA-binding protein [Vibrio alginolyticus]
MKIIKKDIAERVNQNLDIEVTDAQCAIAVDSLLDVMTDKLVLGYPIRLQGVGKLFPYFKKGGRLVRNPKTGETMPMEDRFVVSFITRTNRSLAEKNDKHTLSLWDLIHAVADHPSMIKAKFGLHKNLIKVSETTVRVFSEIVQESREQCGVVELRGFGVFKTTSSERREVRNPKTNETIKLPEGEKCIRTVFREGKMLKKAMNGG